jgi:protein involved in polysaccharide export with SLBB domain
LANTAYTPRVLIYRLNEQDGSRMMVRATAEIAADGRLVANVPLSDQDSVIVFSRGTLTNPQSVSIDGFVKEPGTYALADGMTLKDLILLAGGFVHGAYLVEAEVSRQTDPLVRTDTTAIVRRYRLDGSTDGDMSKSSARPTDVPAWYPAADDVTLTHGDRVFIRRAPGYGVVREVKITGEVMHPGTYVLRNRSERISDLLERAGGLTNEAYADGMHVVRSSRLVAAELARALKKPGDRNNIILQAGDSIHVPAIDPMVAVSGAVTYEARVLYRPGSGLDYYIQQAGGYNAAADKGRLTVTYANGERAGVKKWLTAKVNPDVKPGSVIYVPAKPAGAATGTNWEGIIMRGLTITGSMLTVLIAIKQLQ